MGADEIINIDCYIYTLSGPDKVVRYVGASIDPIARLVTHYHDGIRIVRGLQEYEPTKKALWLAGLFHANQQLTLTVVEKCDIRQAKDVEIKHYLRYADSGNILGSDPTKHLGGAYNMAECLISKIQLARESEQMEIVRKAQYLLNCKPKKGDTIRIKRLDVNRKYLSLNGEYKVMKVLNNQDDEGSFIIHLTIVAGFSRTTITNKNCLYDIV